MWMFPVVGEESDAHHPPHFVLWLVDCHESQQSLGQDAQHTMSL